MGSGFTYGQFVNSFGSTITYLFYKYVLRKKVKYEEIKQGCSGAFVGHSHNYDYDNYYGILL